MNAALAHRGPDGDGFFDDARAAFGHRRLAIIDRAGGHQPMANEDGSLLDRLQRRDLQPSRAPAAARSRRAIGSGRRRDTETILHAYEEFGPACVERLEGMFAFAIYDARRRELFAARDRLGKKPFFYTVLDGMLHFASELPALARAPLWKGEVDLTALEGLSLARLFPRAGDDLPRRLQAAARALAARRATARIERPAVLGRAASSTPTIDPTKRLLDEIDATLRAAVHDRLESEVPLGAFLSGGIDSGLVVSYMAEALGDRLVTTSVGFGERAHNELEAAAVTAVALRQPSLSRDHRAAARRGDRPGHRAPRRAARRLVGHPDLVRLARGAAPCDGGAERRRRRRELRRATTSAMCRTRSRRRARRFLPGGLAPAASVWGACGRARGACRGRCAPGRCSRISAATRQRPITPIWRS